MRRAPDRGPRRAGSGPLGIRGTLAAAPALALLIALVAAVAPAAVPGIRLPAGLAPVTALAADDIDITTSSRYTVDPAARRVRVVVDITAVNRKPDRATGGGVTRFFYDGVNLGIQPEARGLRATQDGSAVRVRAQRRDGYRLVTVLFRENLYFGETARVRFVFHLPAGPPRSDSDVRVGPAFATFTAWAFGDAGRVRIEVPGDFRVEFAGETFEAEPGEDGLQAWTARTANAAAWYAWVTATNDAGLETERLSLAGGDEVVIRGWPEDDRWRSRVRVLLEDGLPRLAESIGLPWPVDGELVVTEVHTPLLEGYAGFYDPSTDHITISEDLDDLTILHEASHAWFNGRLFTGRWITEGLADEYAARTLRADDRGYPGPDRVARRDDVAFPLAEWGSPAAIRDDAAADRERYGYGASWTLVRRIVNRVGEEGMRQLFAAAADRATAYPGEGDPEPTRLPNDWRRFLDLAEQLADPATAGGDGDRSIAQLLELWVLTADEAALLPGRAAALGAYEPLADRGGAWAPPVVVRLALDRWAFGEASEAIEHAQAVLDTRDEIAALAAGEGLTPDEALEAAYQAAASDGDLVKVDAQARASLEALRSLATAADAVAAPRDWLTSLGLEGTDPDGRLTAARAAWEAGDLEASAAGVDAVLADLGGAEDAGRTKAAIVSFGAAAGLGLLLLAALLARGRRRSRRAAAAPTPGAGPAATGAAGAYATLPPDGPPAPPHGAPSPDQGADGP